MTPDDVARQITGQSSVQNARTRYRMLRAFLPTYATEVLRGPPEYGGKFILGPHHLDWGRAINNAHRVLALAARDHGKSHFFVFAYALWQAQIRSPGREGYIISATDQQAKDHLRKIRDEVCGGGGLPPNPKLADLLPLKKDTEREIVFANGSRIKARGFGSKVRGGHPWWVVSDDTLNDEHIWSETTRAKGIDYFLSAIEPMVVPGGQLIVVGTPFHAEDLYAHLERSGEYEVLRHPAIDPATDAPLWPARYNRDALERKKRLLGSNLRWSREFLCQPISDDSSIFPSALFEQTGIKQPYKLGLDAKFWGGQGFTTYMGVDLAISTSANADWFVAFTVAICPRTGDVWVVDIYRVQGLGYQEQVDTIVTMAKKYDCQFVFVEANQYQRVITDMVVRTSSIPIKAFYTTGRGGSTQASTQRRGMAGTYTANKNNLDRGVPALRMLLENVKLRIPWDPETREKVALWVREMQSFSFIQGKLQGVGAHDDTVMAFWMAERASSLGGSFYSDEDEAIDTGLTMAIPTPMGPRTLDQLGQGRAMPSDDIEAGDNDAADAEAPDYFGQREVAPRLPGLGSHDPWPW